MPIRSPSAKRACVSLSLSSAACHARLRFDRYLSKRGQSMTEYLVALAVLAAMLASTGIGDPPVLQLFLESVQAGWARLLSALALPV